MNSTRSTAIAPGLNPVVVSLTSGDAPYNASKKPFVTILSKMNVLRAALRDTRANGHRGHR